MNTKHTPGPLHISRHATPAHSPQVGIYAQGDHHTDIAIIKGPNAEADATLFAAGPDILSRLIDSADAIDAVICNIQGGARDALREINRENRAAIAKAIASV